MYFRVHYTRGGLPGVLDVTAPDAEAAKRHTVYVAQDPVRKQIGTDKYGDRRFQISRPFMVQPNELPEITIDKVITLKKVVNQFVEDGVAE